MFAPCSGVSLEGHIMLCTGDVQHNWLDVRFISNSIIFRLTHILRTLPRSFLRRKPTFHKISTHISNLTHLFLQFIKNISKQDDYLKRIPSYELALSQVLLDICIARRKFMPKAQVVNYAAQLRKVTTAILDYLTYSKFPKTWPATLQDFELVIES